MSSRVRSLSFFLLGILLLTASTGYWLLIQSPSPRAGAFRIDLKSMRELARSRSDDLPERLESLVIGEANFPSGSVHAGDSLFADTPMAFVSYRLAYAKRSLILDTALDRSTHDSAVKTWPFYDDRYEAMQTAMNRASAENGIILLTHEHVDHIGGLARSPRIRELAGVAKLTPEQLNGPSLPESGFPADAKPFFTPYAYEGLASPAPGVVVMKAPGHSPGSQLIYVLLANGTEFLFVGDIAWNRRNIADQVGRPLLVSALLREDRQAVADQLAALHELSLKEPGLRMIVAHDGTQLTDLRLAGDIAEGFSP